MQDHYDQSTSETIDLISDLGITSDAWLPELKCEIPELTTMGDFIFDTLEKSAPDRNQISLSVPLSDDSSAGVTSGNFRAYSINSLEGAESIIANEQAPSASDSTFRFPSYSLDLPDDNMRITSDFSGMSIEDDKRVTTEISMMSLESNKNDLQESNGEEQLKSFDSTPDFKPDSKPSKQSHTGSDLALLDINDIQVWDILIDGGEKSTKHPGNLRFRNLVKEMKEKYNVSTVDNTQLMKEVSKCIVAHVTGYGGRFLRQIPGSDQKWNIMTTDDSIEATYQQMLEETVMTAQEVSSVDVSNDDSTKLNVNNCKAPKSDIHVTPCPAGTEIHEDDIRPSDILAGRGTKINSHPGNLKYRSVVEQMKDQYRAQSNTKHKNILTNSFIEIMKEKHNARFLKKRSDMKSEKMWVVMDDVKIREKVSQALRESKKKQSRSRTGISEKEIAI